MAPNESFRERLARVRQGDDEAAGELFHRYEAEIRRAVRLRLLDARLRRALDSSDICQEVLKGFVLAAEADRYQIDSEEQLLKLLTEMARKKLIDFVRRQRTQRRGGDRKAVEVDRDLQVAAPIDTPSRDAVRKELAGRIAELLTEEERTIFELWLHEKLPWSEIAARLGGTAEGVRQKYNRARRRIREQLGEEGDDDAWLLLG